MYVPSNIRRKSGAGPDYRYGRGVLLGEGTSFVHLLASVASGGINYDSVIHIDRCPDGSWSSKKRNQLRISTKNLGSLYELATVVDCCSTITAGLGSEVDV